MIKKKISKLSEKFPYLSYLFKFKFIHYLKILISRRYRWIANTYSRFGKNNRKNIFLGISRFLHINRPIEGYYFEFGCNEANTIRIAYDSFKNLFKLTYVAFDSFEGLPEPDNNDKSEIFKKGNLSFSEKAFKKICLKHGIPDDKLIIFKGFYEKTLNLQTQKYLESKKAAVIYIDCDLYSSTVTVLKFVKFFLQPGTIIVFDDWNCFIGDPLKGERRAFNEFCADNKSFIFEKFYQDMESCAFIFLGEKTSGY